MAPELLDPDRFGSNFAQTQSSDVYAFGYVCLELYTGQPPLSSLPEPAAFMKVINGERPERPSGSPPMLDIIWQHVTEFWAVAGTNPRFEAFHPPCSPEDGLVSSRSSLSIVTNNQGDSLDLQNDAKGHREDEEQDDAKGYWEEGYWEDEEQDVTDEICFVDLSLLLHIAVQLWDNVPRRTHVKGYFSYPSAFTGRDIPGK
ncbi:hypothetical protein B0H19DRAFT_1267902 [Mycena capillaripes]|nr:hypothetical protein B0H19DRAFT_1267902 [Mycena capillaripes]